jgi:hypothetical protein
MACPYLQFSSWNQIYHRSLWLSLQLHQCGLPYEMTIDFLKRFDHLQNIGWRINYPIELA